MSVASEVFFDGDSYNLSWCFAVLFNVGVCEVYAKSCWIVLRVKRVSQKQPAALNVQALMVDACTEVYIVGGKGSQSTRHTVNSSHKFSGSCDELTVLF